MCTFHGAHRKKWGNDPRTQSNELMIDMHFGQTMNVNELIRIISRMCGNVQPMSRVAYPKRAGYTTAGMTAAAVATILAAGNQTVHPNSAHTKNRFAAIRSDPQRPQRPPGSRPIRVG